MGRFYTISTSLLWIGFFTLRHGSQIIDVADRIRGFLRISNAAETKSKVRFAKHGAHARRE